MGDCDNSGTVAVNDVITMVNIALGTTDASECPAGDANHDGHIAVNDIIAAVNSVVEGCPTATPTPTPTPNATVTPTFAAGEVFHATLTGDQETPPTTSTATGEATFTLSLDETTLAYAVTLTGLDAQQITAAQIRVAAPGMIGPVVLSLAATGLSFHGMLSAADLVPGSGVDSFAALIADLRAGNTYVEVRTQTYRSGEIRGQITAGAS